MKLETFSEETLESWRSMGPTWALKLALEDRRDQVVAHLCLGAGTLSEGEIRRLGGRYSELEAALGLFATKGRSDHEE